MQPVALDAQDGIPARLLSAAEQELAHVHPVDLPIVGDLGTGGEQQRRERVGEMNKLVADLAGGHLARPADQARRSV
ncbi:MAG: hypothetical protein ACLP50_20060 [Solirubrobacteraceae bacterium]